MRINILFKFKTNISCIKCLQIVFTIINNNKIKNFDMDEERKRENQICLIDRVGNRARCITLVFTYNK